MLSYPSDVGNNHCFSWLTDTMTDWLNDRVNESLIDGLIDWLIKITNDKDIYLDTSVERFALCAIKLLSYNTPLTFVFQTCHRF